MIFRSEYNHLILPGRVRAPYPFLEHGRGRTICGTMKKLDHSPIIDSDRNID